MNTILFLYVPCSSKDEAENLVKHLLDMRLIACGNIVEGTSLYEWDSAKQKESEWIVFMKSGLHLESRLEVEIDKFHSYETPAIVRYTVRVNRAYSEWVLAQVQN